MKPMDKKKKSKEKILNSICDTCKDNDICKDVSKRKTCGAYKAICECGAYKPQQAICNCEYASSDFSFTTLLCNRCKKPIYISGKIAKPVEEKKYPCAECGKLRTKDEGGNTFTVCDECWKKKYPTQEKIELEELPIMQSFEEICGQTVYSHQLKLVLKVNEIIRAIQAIQRKE